MRVQMIVETDGVETTVTREYEPNVMQNLAGEPVIISPSLSDVAQAVAVAAATAHLITPKE